MPAYLTQRELMDRRRRRRLTVAASSVMLAAVAAIGFHFRNGVTPPVDRKVVMTATVAHAAAKPIDSPERRQLHSALGMTLDSKSNTRTPGVRINEVEESKSQTQDVFAALDPYEPPPLTPPITPLPPIRPDTPFATPMTEERSTDAQQSGDEARRHDATTVASADESMGAPTTNDARMNATPAVIDGIPADGKVTLTVNRTTVLNTQQRFKQVSIGQPDIAEVTPLGPSSILVTAKKAGATQLIIWDENDQSQVVDVVVNIDLDALRDAVTKHFPNSNVEIDAVNGAIALRGTVSSLQVAEQIVISAQPYSDKVLNFLEISGGQQVMLQVRFLEMSRRASQELGINLAASYVSNSASAFAVGPNITRKLVNPLVSTITGTSTWDNVTLDYALSALKQNSLARILAEPNVTVISGQEASLLAGGEFPVPVPSAGGGEAITIEYREFGVRLNVTPVVLGSGKIRLKVAPEVSDLDFSSPVVIENNQIPIINKRRVSSVVEMADGQTFAIAGLMRNSVTATKNATPILGDLPVIGTLFRSVRYQRDETELVVLVTPRMVEAMNPAEVPNVPGMIWEHPNPAAFYLLGDLGGPAEGPQGGRRGPGQREPMERRPPPRFHGAYGFAPAAGEQTGDRTQTASVER